MSFSRCSEHLAWSLMLSLILLLAVARPAAAQSVSILYSFTGGSDGANPYAGLVQGTDGSFYGTTDGGGSGNGGTVFKITPSGTLTALYAFTGGSNGAGSYAGLVQGTDGNFYGTTLDTVFKISSTSSLNTLYDFTGGSDGDYPYGLVQGSDGNFYGTTDLGGTKNAGTVFRITPSGSLTTLYSFTDGSDGGYPECGLVQGTDGNFYGTTPWAGAHNYGTVFKITPSGTLTTLYSFTGGSDGGRSVAGLIQASDGNFYGTTRNGANGYGTVFKITPSGSLTTLYSFTGGSDGGLPTASVIQANDGNFYGTTAGGGANSDGTVFQITPAGSLTTLYSFTGPPSDGASPRAKLIQGSDGNFYGTTLAGGTDNDGTVFILTLIGDSVTLTSLSPSSAPAGGPAFILTVNGSGFVSGAVVDWNGIPFTTTFVSASQLTASVPASDIASPGSANVTVTQSGQTSNPLTFTINNPAPVLSSLSPASTDAGGPGLTLTVKGSSFLNSSTLNWNGSPLTTTFVSTTQLKATVPSSLIASPGKVKVTVSTPAPGGGASTAKTFTILFTTLKLTGAQLSQNADGSYSVVVSLKNLGYLSASNTTLTKSTLGTAATTSSLPASAGSIAAGATGTITLNYPSTAGSPGTQVTLKVSGTFTGGTFSGSQKVTLP